MPDYKRKKRAKFSLQKKTKPKKENIIFDDIEIEKEIDKSSSLKVVKGKRLHRRRRMRILGAIAVLLVTVLLILSLVLPVGLGENITNLFSVIGTGNYPIDLKGSETLNAAAKGGYYYVLTDTNLTAVSNSGKVIYDYSHGYLKPVLKTSETRALVFDQGGNSLNVFNLKEKVNSFTTENEILTAAIARDGEYAVVTTSDEYTSVVEVFDKSGDLLYRWNSAKDMVNNVAVSRSGEYIAVSTINAFGGQLISNIYILGFDSADYKYKLEITDGTVMSLTDCGDGFAVISNRGFSYIDWEEHTKTDYHSDFDVNIFKKCDDGIVMVLNRESDRSDNKIVIFNSDGEKQTEFNFNGSISDIEFDKSHIYCINESKLFMFDEKGKAVSNYDCGYGCVRLIPISVDTVITITDNSISRIEFNN